MACCMSTPGYRVVHQTSRGIAYVCRKTGTVRIGKALLRSAEAAADFTGDPKEIFHP